MIWSAPTCRRFGFARYFGFSPKKKQKKKKKEWEKKEKKKKKLKKTPPKKKKKKRGFCGGPGFLTTGCGETPDYDNRCHIDGGRNLCSDR